jgi:hypothetical protein
MAIIPAKTEIFGKKELAEQNKNTYIVRVGSCQPFGRYRLRASPLRQGITPGQRQSSRLCGSLLLT